MPDAALALLPTELAYLPAYGLSDELRRAVLNDMSSENSKRNYALTLDELSSFCLVQQPVYQMILTQKAHALSGTMTIMKSGSPPGGSGDYVQAFDITGTTWEGYVTLNLKSSDRKSVAFATSLLQLQERGKSVAGQWYIGLRRSIR